MEVNPPQDRNYGQETRETLQSQIELAPQQYAAQSRYSPLYTDLSVQNARRALLGSDGQPGMLQTLQQVSPQLQGIEDQTALQRRTSDVGALEQLGGRTVEAIKNADPQARALSDALNRQALEELQAGGGLTPEMQARLQQQVRGSQASRGLGFGLSDAVVESYALGDRGEEMRRQRQQFAQQIAGYNAQTAVDPSLAILGRPGQALGASQMAYGQGQGSQPGALFNPESGYAQDIFNTNYNARAASNIANANNRSALIGSGISAAGSIGSAF